MRYWKDTPRLRRALGSARSSDPTAASVEMVIRADSPTHAQSESCHVVRVSTHGLRFGPDHTGPVFQEPVEDRPLALAQAQADPAAILMITPGLVGGIDGLPSRDSRFRRSPLAMMWLAATASMRTMTRRPAAFKIRGQIRVVAELRRRRLPSLAVSSI